MGLAGAWSPLPLGRLLLGEGSARDDDGGGDDGGDGSGDGGGVVLLVFGVGSAQF